MQDTEITDLADHAPGLLTSVVSKLESLYMSLAETNISDPAVRQIPAVVKKARELRDILSSIAGQKKELAYRGSSDGPA